MADHKRAFDLRLGYQVRPFRLHDVRRTFCTRLAELGAMPHIIEAAVNHQSGHKAGIAGIYNHSRYGTQLRTMMDMWDPHIRSLIEGRDERNVVPIRSAGGDIPHSRVLTALGGFRGVVVLVRFP
jgi:hypothetical protein